MERIFLTSGSAKLIAEIGVVLPKAEVAIIHPDLPQEQLNGESWCFVDWILNDISGIEFCRRLRATPTTSHTHITIVLDDDDQLARRRALGAGADDYMLGPLSAKRLIERLDFYKANEREPVLAKPALANGALTLDHSSHQVRWQGRLIPLRPREFSLLALFLSRADQLLTREKIIALLGEDSRINDERTVDVWMGRLRRTLEDNGVPKVLRTVRSIGYIFDTPLVETVN